MTVPVANPYMQKDEIDLALFGELGTAFLLLLSSIMRERAILASRNDYPVDNAPNFAKKGCPDSYDFIIVGAGAAGVVLANRLTEEGKWSVLLIEAGGYPSASTDVPAFYPSFVGSNEDWDMKSVPQYNACLGMRDRRCKIFRGQILGGTSTINNLHYMRALPSDLEDWPPEFLGSKDEIYKKFSTLENCRKDCDKNFVFGTGGEIDLAPLNGDSDYRKLILAGGAQMGYNAMTVDNQKGYVTVLGTIRNGSRANYAKAFLKRCKDRPNLVFASNAYVTKILTKLPDDGRVSGVIVTRRDQDYIVNAKKEVILTGGAITTAQLLMLSGFGPREDLTKLGISVVADLNVGQGFSDQISAFVFVGINDAYRANKKSHRKGSDLIDDTYSYVMHRSGRFTNTDVNDIIGFINTRTSCDCQDANLMIYHKLFKMGDDMLGGYLHGLGFHSRIITSIEQHNRNQTLLLFAPTLIKPRSKGYVKLQGDSPHMNPIIHPNYLSDNCDLRSLISGVDYVLDMIEKPSFQAWNAHLIKVDMPYCKNFPLQTPAYIQCLVKSMTVPNSQPIGTAIFGSNASSDRVVDQDLLVDGIRHLRVVDGSVLKSHISGNMEATMAMMADTVAGRIKQYWKQFGKQ